MDYDVKVAAATMRIRESFSLFAKDLARLRSFRDFQFFFAAKCGNANLCAQRSLSETHRNGAIQICPAPLEKRVFLHFEENVEIARRAAMRKWRTRRE